MLADLTNDISLYLATALSAADAQMTRARTRSNEAYSHWLPTRIQPTINGAPPSLASDMMIWEGTCFG